MITMKVAKAHFANTLISLIYVFLLLLPNLYTYLLTTGDINKNYEKNLARKSNKFIMIEMIYCYSHSNHSMPIYAN